MNQPWLPEPAIQWLDDNVKSNWDILELGSGGSTLLFANKVVGYDGHLMSVENNPQWYTKVRFELEKIKPEKDYRNYVQYYMVMDSEKDYLGPIRDQPIQAFDLILIDGRHRDRCFEEAVSRVKPGGWILFDNFFRGRYLDSWKLAQELGWDSKVFYWTVPDNGKEPKPEWHCMALQCPWVAKVEHG